VAVGIAGAVVAPGAWVIAGAVVAAGVGVALQAASRKLNATVTNTNERSNFDISFFSLFDLILPDDNNRRLITLE
jgi:hypothetical protein